MHLVHQDRADPVPGLLELAQEEHGVRDPVRSGAGDQEEPGLLGPQQVPDLPGALPEAFEQGCEGPDELHHVPQEPAPDQAIGQLHGAHGGQAEAQVQPALAVPERVHGEPDGLVVHHVHHAFGRLEEVQGLAGGGVSRMMRS